VFLYTILMQICVHCLFDNMTDNQKIIVNNIGKLVSYFYTSMHALHVTKHASMHESAMTTALLTERVDTISA
jgi:ferric iron reductase protein FhuF